MLPNAIAPRIETKTPKKPFSSLISSKYNSIRTDLSYVNQKKNPKSPYTKPQIKIVNSILTSFSLPLIK